MNYTSLGFIFDDLGASQNAYTCIFESNKHLENNIDTNINIFYQDHTSPCLQPKFARFNLKEIIIFDGHLICPTFESLISSKEAQRCKRYYYITDLEWERSWFRHSKQLVKEVLSDPTIIKFTRSLDYYNLLTEQGYKLKLPIVEHFQTNKILEVINA